MLLNSPYETVFANEDILSERIYFAAMVLDGASIVIFFLGIWWIRREQDYEVKEYESLTCRANDYTVECHTIPPHEDDKDLKIKLQSHFEYVLSRVEPFMYSGPIKIAGAIHICISFSFTDSILLDINIVSRNFTYIRAACNRGTLSVEIDRILGKYTSRLRQGTFNHRNWSDISLMNRLKKLMYDFEIVNRNCELLQSTASKKYCLCIA